MATETATWDEARRRAQFGKHIWLPKHIKPGDELDGEVLFEWQAPDDEGEVALGRDSFGYMQTTYELARDGYTRWPECTEHRLFVNMGPGPSRRTGTHFCCMCGLDFNLVARRVMLPSRDSDYDEEVQVVTIVRPS